MTSKYENEIKKIEESGLFDPVWYQAEYPDTQFLNMTPIEHYLWLGATLGRNPSPKFDVAFYLKSYPEAANSGINPLLYFIEKGRAAGHETVSPDEKEEKESTYKSVDLLIEEEELREENELLLLQLHQVQEELETYYLKYQELKNRVEEKEG